MDKRLYRSESDRMLGGIGGGLADYFQADPTLVRFALLAGLLLSGGTAFLLYVAAWMIVPKESTVTIS
jgi:phage shock protein C